MQQVKLLKKLPEQATLAKWVTTPDTLHLHTSVGDSPVSWMLMEAWQCGNLVLTIVRVFV
jgi:hypothetical protein